MEPLYKDAAVCDSVVSPELAHPVERAWLRNRARESSQPETKATSKSICRPSSPRRQQIENSRQKITSESRRGANCAHPDREGKLELSTRDADSTRQWPRSSAIIPTALLKSTGSEESTPADPERKSSRRSTYSREKNRSGRVAEERRLLMDALRNAMCDSTVAEVKAEFENRVQAATSSRR